MFILLGLVRAQPSLDPPLHHPTYSLFIESIAVHSQRGFFCIICRGDVIAEPDKYLITGDTERSTPVTKVQPFE